MTGYLPSSSSVESTHFRKARKAAFSSAYAVLWPRISYVLPPSVVGFSSDDGAEPQKQAAVVKADREFQETNGKKPKAKPTSPPPSATEASSGDVKKNVSE